MDLQQPSRFRGLLLAILVGLFALAANQYVKMHPQSLKLSIESAEEYALKFVNAYQEPVSPVITRTIELQKIHQTISETFAKWKSQRHAVDGLKLNAAAQEVNQICLFLDEEPTLTDAERHRYQMQKLVVFFMMAEMQPEAYSQEFLAFCSQGIEQNTSGDTQRIELLRFYHQVDFRSPDREQLLEQLSNFSQSHDEKTGVALYCMVAEELALQRHQDLAVGVLKQGLEVYDGGVGVSRLVNALVEVQESSRSNY